MTTNDNSGVRAGLAVALALFLVACGGADPAQTSVHGEQARSTSAAQDRSDAEAPSVSPANAQPDARLTAQTLAQAEIQAQKADTSQPLERLLPGSIAAKAAYVSGAIARKADAVRIPAFRFYNAHTGAHFFTTSTAERDHIVNTLSPPFSLEGPAFSVASDFSPGLSPVHRFYNTRTGVHFYTISEAERANVVATLPHMQYEGVAYHASQVAGQGLIPLYRFFVPSRGVHFYTANEAEKDSIIANLSATYSFEGIGYHVLGSDHPLPAPPLVTYHFSDCQTGAAVGCVPGNNANPGTQAAPKQNLAGFNVNNLPAGAALLFNRGGAWNWTPVTLENSNTTAAAPLVFDTYGTGPLPTFRQSSGNMFHLGGNWNNTSNDGGYTFRNIKFDGLGTAVWGFWFVHTVRDVVIENSEITGFAIGINSNDSDAHGVRGITLRNNHIHHNHDMGMLGHYNDLLIEGNLIEANNFSGSGFSHGTYLGGGHNITVRNNRYLRNSVVNGVCQGGNMTFHGQIDGLLIEGNRIEQDVAAGGCWLVSITTGYTTAEWFLNTVVRNNKFINGGNTALVAQAAPGIVVEGNVAINTQATNQVGFNVGGGVGAGDTLDANAVVRNNTACQSGGATGSVVSVNSPGATVANNVVVTGAAATTGICAR